MAKPKKSGKKTSVKVNDMAPKEDPKGGAYDAFLKYDSRKSTTETAPTATVKRSNKVQF